MKPVEYVFTEGRIERADKDNRRAADAVLRLDPTKMTDNVSFAKLAEALKHFTSQNQWPPAGGE